MNYLTHNKDILLPIMQFLDTRDIIRWSACNKTLRQITTLWQEISSRFKIANDRIAILSYLKTPLKVPVYYFCQGNKIRRIQHHAIMCYPAEKLTTLAKIFDMHKDQRHVHTEKFAIGMNASGRINEQQTQGIEAPPFDTSSIKSEIRGAEHLFFATDAAPELVSAETLSKTLEDIRNQETEAEVGPFGFFSLQKTNVNGHSIIEWRPVENLSILATLKPINGDTEVGCVDPKTLLILRKNENENVQVEDQKEQDALFQNILF